MEYLAKIADVLSVAAVLGATAGLIFRYYLKAFFDKVDERANHNRGFANDRNQEPQGWIFGAGQGSGECQETDGA